MKQITLFTCLLFSGFVFSQNINIPDAVFLNKLIAAGVDTNNDGQISYSEALAVTFLNVSSNSNSSQIEDMEGVQYFTNVVYLNCNGNKLTSLDLTGLNQLVDLRATNNKLTSITLTGLDNLETIWISGNNLISLDFSGLDKLTWVWANSTKLTQIILDNTLSLEALWLYNNQLTEIDFSTSPNLKYIDISANFISELNVNHLTHLELLECTGNLIESIDIDNLNSLVELYMGYNLLTEIDASQASALYLLHCYSNPDLEYINMQNGVISGADPDMLFYGFYFYDLPNLKFICMDPGEEHALSHSGYDSSTVAVSTTDCAMSINDFAFDSIILYPNPVKDSFTISSTQNILEYQVFDILGKQNIKSTNFRNLQNEVLKLNPGYYFLEITSNENQKKTIRFLKQ